MKKILLAGLIALSSQFALAGMDTKSIDPEFVKIEAMVKANNLTGAYQALGGQLCAGQKLYCRLNGPEV